MAGGQPISMKNLKEVRKFTNKHGIKIFLDMTRVAENAWFIKKRGSMVMRINLLRLL